LTGEYIKAVLGGCFGFFWCRHYEGGCLAEVKFCVVITGGTNSNI